MFSAVRKRGIAGSPKLAYFEWSAGNGEPEKDNPAAVSRALRDKAAWAQANPALGGRIPVETMEDEYEELRHLPRTFAVELGIGDWPEMASTNPIDIAAFDELEDPLSKRGPLWCSASTCRPTVAAPSPSPRSAKTACGMSRSSTTRAAQRGCRNA